MCGSFCSLRTVPHSLFRCGWCSCSCCLGGIVVNLRCFLFIILNFLFLFWREINTNLFPFLFCYFVVFLMSDVCLSAFLLLLLLLPLLLPAPENKLTPHTYHHTQSLCECVCVFAYLCVCACVSPFLFCAAIHSGTMERGELN